MNTWTSIRYRDLWDVPRIFVTTWQNQTFLLDCEFDESTEDYRDSYVVYRMPGLSESDLAGSWDYLPRKALCRLGEVPVTSVHFDLTRRREIDASILDQFLTASTVNGAAAQLAADAGKS